MKKQQIKYDINEIYRKLTTSKPRLTVFYIVKSTVPQPVSK